MLGDLAINQDWEIIQSKTQPVYQAIIDTSNPTVISTLLNIDIKYDDPIEIRAQNIIDQAQGLDIFDGGIYFLDQNARIYKTWPDQPELIGQVWPDIDYFVFMKEHPGRGAWHDLKYIETSEKEILCVSLAMTGAKGEFLGASYYCLVVYPVTQNAYHNALNNLNLDPNILLLDGNQRIIFSLSQFLLPPGEENRGKGYFKGHSPRSFSTSR